MRLTVAICTWNRAALLDETLARMQRLRVPAGIEWELIVVNNNCTDATDDVLARHALHLPLRRLVEPKPGLSNARNCAVAAATGEYVLWTDDDVLVDPDWLRAYHRAFTRWPDAAVFGGRIEPWFAGRPPAWLVQVFPRVCCAFAARDLGGEPRPLDRDLLPFGANMAVRTEELRRRPFDPRLGVRPGSRIGGEETTLAAAILEAGGTGWWVPDARVRHYIPEQRQSIGYLRSFFYGGGQLWGRELKPSSTSRLFGRPRWLLRRAVESEVRYRVKRWTARPSSWIEDLIAASTAWGALDSVS